MDVFRSYQMRTYPGVAGPIYFDHTLNNLAPVTLALLTLAPAAPAAVTGALGLPLGLPLGLLGTVLARVGLRLRVRWRLGLPAPTAPAWRGALGLGLLLGCRGAPASLTALALEDRVNQLRLAPGHRSAFARSDDISIALSP